MNETRVWRAGRALAAAGLLAGWVFVGTGCTPEQIARWNRQWKKAPGYNEAPLRQFGRFDTRERAAALRNDKLRDRMRIWFDYRDRYQELWVEHGEYDEQVRDVKRRMDLLKAIIEDHAMQLTAHGGRLD